MADTILGRGWFLIHHLLWREYLRTRRLNDGTSMMRVQQWMMSHGVRISRSDGILLRCGSCVLDERRIEIGLLLEDHCCCGK